MNEIPPGCPWHGNKWMEIDATHPSHAPINNVTVWICTNPTGQIVGESFTKGCRIIICMGHRGVF